METAAKRKMLWGKKDTGELTEQQKLWANLSVGDEKKTNKFQKVFFLNYLEKSTSFN